MSVHLHLAGIIPIANFDDNFGLTYPWCLLPLDEAFSMIQKSVFECAIAGCQTIWIVANNDLAPIIRKTIGEWTYDPVYYYRKEKFYKDKRKEIPIYYVPIHPKDRERRDSYGWAALYGMHSAWYVASRLSKWIVPEKYYISFPHSAFNIYSLREHRQQISHHENNFFLSHLGETVKDNKHLPFTMFGEDFKNCRRFVNKETTRTYYNLEEGEKYPSKKLPIDERWSARKFDIKTVFSQVNETGSKRHEVEWFWDVGTWEGYRQYLASSNFIQRPSNNLTAPHKHSILCNTQEVLK
tara:strand:- start:627 stop:1514 length:888 start_codon:yes stop_codon:yes gene_type:complete